MGKLPKVLIAGIASLLATVGMAETQEENRREDGGAPVLWTIPLGTLTHDRAEMTAHPNFRTISAKNICHVAPPKTAYTLTFQDRKLSEAAEKRLIEQMFVPAVCETGFATRTECLSFGERLAKAAIADAKDIAVRVSCHRESDGEVLVGYIGSDKDRWAGEAFRFSGGGRF